MFKEFGIFIQALSGWVLGVLLVSCIFFTVGAHPDPVAGWKDPRFIVGTTDSMSAQVFAHMKHDLLPGSVRLMVVDPVSPFVVDLEISIILALLALSPFLLWATMGYLFSALHAHERRLLLKVVAPASILFFLGCFFTYRFVLPPFFSFLYLYAPALGADAYFSVDTFLGNSVAVMFSIGIMFQLPIIMALLTSIGIVSSSFWAQHWRFAVLTFLTATAIITPDGSGITMLILSAPLTLLYAIGFLVSRRLERKRQRGAAGE